MQKSVAVTAGVFMALGLASEAVADAGAEGVAVGSPGFRSGNVTPVPVLGSRCTCRSTCAVFP